MSENALETFEKAHTGDLPIELSLSESDTIGTSHTPLPKKSSLHQPAKRDGSPLSDVLLFLLSRPETHKVTSPDVCHLKNAQHLRSTWSRSGFDEAMRCVPSSTRVVKNCCLQRTQNIHKSFCTNLYQLRKATLHDRHHSVHDRKSLWRSSMVRKSIIRRRRVFSSDATSEMEGL